MVTIAQRIEALRTQKGMSRPGLSAALGLPRQAVEKFETGRLTPNQEQQAKIAAYFGVSVGYLLGQSDGGRDILDEVDVAFYGGCNGNLQGISSLVKGMKYEDVIARLNGISCNGRPTSCPDQLCRAIEQLMQEQPNKTK